MERDPRKFDPSCRRCTRLARFLEQVRKEHPEYHSAPVASFGDPDPDLLVVGLAPGMHGANATGRPFTGDFAGILLYQTLYDFGYSNQAHAVSRRDGLNLNRCRITNAVKCLPPENKPSTAEVNACNGYLAAELASLREGTTILALGVIAHNAVIRALGLKAKYFRFAHGAEHPLPGRRTLFDSYHCSRYNTQTRRLTATMFADVFARIGECLGSTARKGAIQRQHDG